MDPDAAMLGFIQLVPPGLAWQLRVRKGIVHAQAEESRDARL